MRRSTIIYTCLIVTGVLLLGGAFVAWPRETAAISPGTASPSPSDLDIASGVSDPSPSTAPNCGAFAFDKPSTAALRSSKKKAFAFYFPPFPVSIENKDPASDSYNKWQFTGDATGKYDLRDRPIGRPVRGNSWRQQDFELEVRQAIAVGLDGFIWEYHTHATDQRWNQLPAMLAAVKAVDPGFRIMLSPDLPQEANTLPDGIISDVLKVKNEPALFRHEGSIVLAPFYPERKAPSFWDGVRNSLSAQGVKTTMMPLFLDGTPDSRGPQWNDSVIGYSRWGSSWAGSAGSLATMSSQAHQKSRLFMAPIIFEDTRTYSGQYWESGNSATLRATMEKAISGGADWVYFRTWNDYTESWMAPSAQRGHSVGDVAAYYLTWFKTGSRPALKRDAVYYFHRSHHTSLGYDTSKQVKPMKLVQGDPVTDDVELLAFLAAPGKLTITQGGDVQTKDAEAGVISFKVPLRAGNNPVFELHRETGVVISARSATATKTSISLQDWMYHGGGGTACR